MSEAKESFVTVTAANEGPIDPFELGDTLAEIEVDPKQVKELKNGSYLINVSSEADLNAVLQIETLAAGTKVNVKPHASLNGCKRVFTCPQIKDKTEDFVLKRLAPVGVVAVKKKKATFFLTFNTTTPPETVKIGVLENKLSRFYRDPLICRNCFAVAHLDKQCRNKTACRKCGGYHDQSGHCNRPPKCRNCNGAHMPTDKRCPYWIQEAAIIRLMVDKDLPGPKARERYRAAHKRDYIVPPPIHPNARKGPVAPPPESADPAELKAPEDAAKPKAPAVPAKPKAPAPSHSRKRSATVTEGTTTKTSKKKREKAQEEDDQPKTAKTSKPSGRTKSKKATSPEIPDADDDDPFGTLPKMSPSEEYDAVMRAIYDSPDESDDDKKAKAKARRRKTK